MQLASSPELRAKMGETGKKHAKATFDWSVVVKRYQELWTQLAKLRAEAPESASHDSAGRHVSYPARMDPFDVFEHYATESLSDEHRVSLPEGSGPDRLKAYRQLSTTNYASAVLPEVNLCNQILNVVAKRGTATVAELLKITAANQVIPMKRALVWMMKIDVLKIDPPQRG